MRDYKDKNNSKLLTSQSGQTSLDSYKSGKEGSVHHYHFYAAICMSVIFLVVFIFFDSTKALSKRLFSGESLDTSSETLQVVKEIEETAPQEASFVEIKIDKNDSFYNLLVGLSFSHTDIINITKTSKKIYDFRSLKEGNLLRVKSVDGDLERLEYHYSTLNGVVVEKDGNDGFKTEKIIFPYKVNQKVVNATIETSLYEAGLKAGINANVMMNLTDIFAWDVDFATEIYKGDSFSVVYEEIVVEGKKPIIGKIVAASITNNKREYSAIKFNGKFYDKDGRSVTRTLLKSPLRYSRISSRFGKRFHPIKKRYRAHHGVDYASPRGTPVESSGDGVIVKSGWNGGYGKYIEIKHKGKYKTAYGHLSKIAKGIRKGRRVKQGQVIGYVGSTGNSTGPHLHYEVKVWGQVVNPLKIKSSPRKFLKQKEKGEFAWVRDDMMAKLYPGENKSLFASLKAITLK